MVYAESCPSTIGPITLEVKQTGERSAGNPHAAFDVGPITLEVKQTGERSAGNPHAAFDARQHETDVDGTYSFRSRDDRAVPSA